MTDHDFHALAAEQLRHEDDLKFQARVRERAARLAEEHRRQTHTDFPSEPQMLRAKHATLVGRQRVLEARQRAARQNPALTLSAAEDDELRVLAGRVHELSKRIRQLDRAAA